MSEVFPYLTHKGWIYTFQRDKVMHGLNELNERLWRGRAEALLNTIEAGTQQTYRRRVTKLVRQYGGCGYAEVLQIHPGALIAGTVDVVGDVECSGKDTPGCWRADERRRERRFVRSNRRGRVPGVEEGDERNTKVTRGDLDEQKLKQVCGLAHEHNLEDIADGFVVMWGICCRPRDMGELQASQVDLKREVVLVRRKTWRKKRMREGEYEAHPIATRGARMLLSRRMT